MPGLNLFLNNRDHRKITVIDGKVGFTGGYNLANAVSYTHLDVYKRQQRKRGAVVRFKD